MSKCPRMGKLKTKTVTLCLQQPPYRRSADYADDGPSLDMQPRPPMRTSNPLPGAQRGQGNMYHRSPSPGPTDSFSPPSSSKPRPAPRPPRMQPSPPKPQPRQTPSPPVNRPGSGPNIRDQLVSPPAGDQLKDSGRPDSSGKPPGEQILYKYNMTINITDHLIRVYSIAAHQICQEQVA